MNYKHELDKIQWTAIALIATLVAIMIILSLIFPNPNPGKPLPGGEQYPIQNPAS
jgi:hypothetical protein